jgi:hypothetical protein
MYALVLGNILSPKIWRWGKDPFFRGLEKKTWNRRIQRLKQYIMDHYTFNLDLETWGLTTRGRELERFSPWIDPERISRSNALFGYEGDRHYFDLDIRRHFGLDRYTDEIIPYWKTETVEAMDAFRFKDGHQTGAGECVSLAGLYTAALFLVLGVPLERIFMMATPLHSQNYIDLDEGIITNNRRVLTKTMWFNGTVLSQKARRALEKEQVTIVSHVSGYTHVAYPEASIDPGEYARFRKALGEYLVHPLDFEMFANFLRVHNRYQKYFQFEYRHEGQSFFITAENLFRYEHSSKYRIGDSSYKKFLQEIDLEEFQHHPFENRDVLNVIKQRLNENSLYCRDEARFREFHRHFRFVEDPKGMCEDLKSFVCTRPELPDSPGRTAPSAAIDLPPGIERGEVLERLGSLRKTNRTADLAFSAARWVDADNAPAYLKACLERNPVSVERFAGMSETDAAAAIRALPGASIYEGDRLATPDEVVNFHRGDGIEKAVTLANCLRARDPSRSFALEVENGSAVLRDGKDTHRFETAKDISLAVEYPGPESIGTRR